MTKKKKRTRTRTRRSRVFFWLVGFFGRDFDRCFFDRRCFDNADGSLAFFFKLSTFGNSESSLVPRFLACFCCLGAGSGCCLGVCWCHLLFIFLSPLSPNLIGVGPTGPTIARYYTVSGIVGLLSEYESDCPTLSEIHVYFFFDGYFICNSCVFVRVFLHSRTCCQHIRRILAAYELNMLPAYRLGT